MKIEIKQYTKDYLDILYLAGRGCYGLEELTNESFNNKRDFIKNIIDNGHESVLEHGIISILVHGCSRSFMSQITRHRLVSFSVKSQHYVNHSDFYAKKLETNKTSILLDYEELMIIINSYYKDFVKQGLPIHVAREILPNCCLTNIFMTANFREWRYIIQLRQTFSNTIEMRQFALKIKDLFNKFIPEVFEDL